MRWIVFLLQAVLAVCPALAGSDDRVVPLTVVLKASYGPLADVLLYAQVQGPADRWVRERTDASGTATLNVPCPEGEPALVRVTLGIADPRTDIDRVKELTRRYVFPDNYMVEIASTDQSRTLSIQVPSAVSATIPLVRGGHPFTGTARPIMFERYLNMRPFTNPIVCGGLLPGTPSIVYMIVNPVHVLRVVIPPLNEDATVAPVDVPEVPAMSAQLRVRLLRAYEVETFRYLHMEGITLVSTHGDSIMGFGARLDGDRLVRRVDEPIEVPAGDYFVLPLGWTARPAQVALVEMAVAGTVPEGLAVPRITVRAGEVAEVTIDAVAVEAAILAVGAEK